jgi:solute carrier family 35 protein C2
MCKSSSLIFVLLFAFVFGLEKPRLRLVLIILVISIGLMMMVANETDFKMLGFVQVMLASVMGGLRWSLTQLLLTDNRQKTQYEPLEQPKDKAHHQHPVATILHLAPVMAVFIFTASIVVESEKFPTSKFFESWQSVSHIMAWMLLGGCVAFAMVVSEFEVIKRIGVVSLSIAGIVKEVLTIGISMWYFGDELHLLNYVGMAVTIAGIAVYNWFKWRASTITHTMVPAVEQEMEVMEVEDEETQVE